MQSLFNSGQEPDFMIDPPENPQMDGGSIYLDYPGNATRNSQLHGRDANLRYIGLYSGRRGLHLSVYSDLFTDGWPPAYKRFV